MTMNSDSKYIKGIRRIIKENVGNGKVLDAGCGSGMSYHLLNNGQRQIFQLDIQDVRIVYRRPFASRRKGGILIGTPNRNRPSNGVKEFSGSKITLPESCGKDPVVGKILHFKFLALDSLRSCHREDQ